MDLRAAVAFRPEVVPVDPPRTDQHAVADATRGLWVAVEPVASPGDEKLVIFGAVVIACGISIEVEAQEFHDGDSLGLDALSRNTGSVISCPRCSGRTSRRSDR